MTHSQKVERLKQELLKAQGNVALDKKVSYLFREGEKTRHKLDVSSFNEVLSIEDGFVEVEGMVPMVELAEATLKKGYVPQVLIEFKGITVGGAVSGIALEASSFKYGLFHEQVEEMEVLVPTGEVITATRTNNSDLFYAMPNSYGTLGYILKLKIKLIGAKKYVHLKHTRYQDLKKCLEDLENLSQPDRDHNFVEGTVFGKQDAVITVGTFTDTAPYTSDYTWTKVYYKSLQKREEDYLTAYDFLFRWDTDLWWATRGTPLLNPLVRFFLAKFVLGSRRQRRLEHSSFGQKLDSIIKHFENPREKLIQDIGFDKDHWDDYLDFLLNEVPILPIWICPFLGNPDFKLFPTERKTYFDFGFWGLLPAKEEKYYWNRLAEKKTFEMKGVKSLYSDVTYTEEEFWKNSNRAAYEAVKKKYDPEGKLKGLYEKVSGK